MKIAYFLRNCENNNFFVFSIHQITVHSDSLYPFRAPLLLLAFQVPEIAGIEKYCISTHVRSKSTDTTLFMSLIGISIDKVPMVACLLFSIKSFNMRNQLCFRPLRMEMMVVLFIFQILLPIQTGAQSGAMKVKVTGTGNTTGHIANLSVTNSTGSPVKINEQTCFIPSDGQYQPYIATIPEHTFPPGTTTILLDGYCADVRTPPVPGGDPLPPIEDWIPVAKPDKTTTGGGINILPMPELPVFLPKDIPNLIRTPGYTSIPSDPESDIIATWPGTDIPVGGNIDPVNFPERFAPVLVDALDKIIAAFDESKGEGKIVTPFSGDAERERESVIQQTFWIFAAGITGERYQKEHFQDKVVEQFENNSDTSIEALPLEDKEKLDSGIDEFWNTFTAVGTQAKVLSKGQGAGSKG